MRKLIFLILALCLSSPIFAATVSDSVKVAAADDDGRKGTAQWTTKLAVNGRQAVAFGIGYTGTFRFILSVPANATFTSMTFSFRNANAKTFKVIISAFDSSAAYQMSTSDSTLYLAQLAKQTTETLHWDDTSADTLTIRTSGNFAEVGNELLENGALESINIFIKNDDGTVGQYAAAWDYTIFDETNYTMLHFTYTTPDTNTNDGRNQKVFPFQNRIKGRRK